MKKRFRYRKVTPVIFDKMNELRERGYSYKKIANYVNLACSTIQYHLDSKYKEQTVNRSQKYNRRLTKKQIRKKNKRRSKYQREYLRDRYQNDAEFREKFKRMLNENLIKRRKIWVKIGLCSSCGHKRDNKDLRHCKECRNKSK